ncbi:clotting factor G beta subunit-like [Macrobrachium rosenbergii]|uniref:clotting factor G beta subunit-like n=1 Tax=Macrobrachium rosenbergii TaxID=79674 RepID=UPI0034D638D9
MSSQSVYRPLIPRFLVILVITGAAELLVENRDESSPKCVYPVRKIPVSGKTSLTLMSPNFPASYEFNTRCGWSLRPVSKSVSLRMNCDTFHVQGINDVGKCPDFLEIMETRYCGSDPPRNITATNLKRLKVLFKSNGRDNYEGFKCTVEGMNSNTEGCSCGAGGGLPESPPQKTGSPTNNNNNNSFPWVAAIVKADTDVPLCSASVIYEDWLLTSASCVERIKYNKYNYAVFVGAQNVTSETRSRNLHQIKRVLIHHDYNSAKDRTTLSESDIGLVQLTEPVDFRTQNIRPICLPGDPSFELTGRRAMFTGWGTDYGAAEAAVDSQESLLLSQISCRYSFQDTATRISNSWLCSSLRDQPNACFSEGDLGGPLLVRSDSGRYVQVGVALHSSGCTNATTTLLPLIYTSVNKYTRWIKKSVELSDTCA